MLVYAKIPRGVLYLNNQPIHGRETGYEPADIPFDVYDSCSDGLEDGTYREAYLSKKFNAPFPPVAFTYGELRWMPEETINKIGPLMCKDFDTSWSFKHKIDSIKIAIRNISCR